jgi:hypothetical protein
MKSVCQVAFPTVQFCSALEQTLEPIITSLREKKNIWEIVKPQIILVVPQGKYASSLTAIQVSSAPPPPKLTMTQFTAHLALKH